MGFLETRSIPSGSLLPPWSSLPYDRDSRRVKGGYEAGLGGAEGAQEGGEVELYLGECIFLSLVWGFLVGGLQEKRKGEEGEREG